ncbi:MAG: hypothetical protein OIN85_04490 [Candidatus Methanoperedens sp.]|nr:hypothetical protein [Candidatus Methanoperedens sp.]
MTNIREPVLYEGLNISITRDESKPFYLTGDTPSFRVRVHNPSVEKRKFGKIALTWKLLRLKTKRIIPIDVPPKETKEYEIMREWLYTEGMARYDLQIIGPPEDYIDTTDEFLESMLSRRVFSIHPLCSYYVRDKETYEYEKAEHEERLKFDRSLNKLTWLLLLFTVAIVIFTALIFLKDLGVDFISIWSKFIKLIN